MKFAKNRVEAISDGVIAIIMTIMVLNIPLPASFDAAHVLGLLASVLVFFVSFFVVGFFWHQHYRLFHDVKEVTGPMSWRNLLFLFALSLMPVFTKWVIGNLGQVVPAVAYAMVFLLVNICYQFMFSSFITDEHRARMAEMGFGAWKHLVIWAVIVVAVIVLSLFLPLVASILLIGLPLIFSLINLWMERVPRGGGRPERGGP